MTLLMEIAKKIKKNVTIVVFIGSYNSVSADTWINMGPIAAGHVIRGQLSHNNRPTGFFCLTLCPQPVRVR